MARQVVVTALNVDGGSEVLGIGVGPARTGLLLRGQYRAATDAPRHLVARMAQTWPRCDVGWTRVTAPASDSEPE